MSITLEQGTYILATALTLVKRHDERRGKGIELRAEFEFVQGTTDVDVNKIRAGLEKMELELSGFQRRLCQRLDLPSYTEFCLLTERAKDQLQIVLQFRERIHSSTFYLDVYKTSGIDPQFMDSKESYSYESEVLKIENVRKQLESAEQLFLSTVSVLDIGPISPIMLLS